MLYEALKQFFAYYSSRYLKQCHFEEDAQQALSISDENLGLSQELGRGEPKEDTVSIIRRYIDYSMLMCTCETRESETTHYWTRTARRAQAMSSI
jgi:hypothetical protein